ncbi:hypothetical protein L210DRAFT_902012 [Boletus edulis BED1]|uniref:Uncharacterized protein n=1 Tax=Boletus edulis BED1 TaxID=1328754 RepID=A0AAD4BN08_BOLED|nr:hypothetical protein L210DRAFT_902012 [Boletus edulis BED1]
MKLCMKHPRLGSLRRFLDSVPLSRSLLVQYAFPTLICSSHPASQFHLTPFDLHLHLASILVVELRVHILSLFGCRSFASNITISRRWTTSLRFQKHWVSWPKSLFCIYCAHPCILLVLLYSLQKSLSLLGSLIHLLHPPSFFLPHRIS